MAYLPRPDAAQTAQDVDEIYALTAEALQRAQTPAERVATFRQGLLRAYEAGIDAQRVLLHTYEHDRPTPVPPPPVEEEDPGTLPPGPRPVAGTWRRGGPKKT